MSITDDNKRSVDDWVEMVQPHVDYCITCQPYDGGEAIWILGDQCDMGEFLDEFEVPEELHEEVASKLYCNNCGAELDITSDIGIKSAAEREEEQRREEYWKAWELEYEPKLKDFIQFLSLYPYLGCNHQFGQHILDEISEFPTATIDDESWWRARKPEGAQRFSSTALYPPDASCSEGRYSHYGQRVFYLASTAEAAGLEVLGEGESLVWIQGFTLHNITHILDLAAYIDERDSHVSVLKFGLDHTDAHREPADPGSPWKPQYFLPRFIADCARRKGCRGIRFRSHKHSHENLVLFEWSQSEVEPIGTPTIIVLGERGEGSSIEPF